MTAAEDLKKTYPTYPEVRTVLVNKRKIVHSTLFRLLRDEKYYLIPVNEEYYVGEITTGTLLEAQQIFQRKLHMVEHLWVISNVVNHQGELLNVLDNDQQTEKERIINLDPILKAADENSRRN